MQGLELKAIREGLGWGQRKFADEIGMTQTFVGMMERGERPIELRTALAARYLALRQPSPNLLAAMMRKDSLAQNPMPDLDAASILAAAVEAVEAGDL